MSSKTIFEILLNPSDNTEAIWGVPIGSLYHVVWVNGGIEDDTFSLSEITTPTLGIMDNYKRGVWVDLGGGLNTVTGSQYGDSFFISGNGTSLIDGVASTGISPAGFDAQDVLEVFVTPLTSVSVTAVSPSDGVDQSYEYKITGPEGVAFVKNIDGVNVRLWDDLNQDGVKDWGSEVFFDRYVSLSLDINEVLEDPNNTGKTYWGEALSNVFHMAWVNGGLGDDTFVAANNISDPTLGNMQTYKRGLWVDLGAGTNEAVGSDYGDNFTMGSGVNYFDGGDNDGTTPWGEAARDLLDVYVTSADQTVTVSAVTANDGTKAQGYEYKVTIDGQAGIAYVKNIEGINVQLWDDKNGNGQRDWDQDQTKNEMTFQDFIPLALNVGEIRVKQNSNPKETEWGEKLSDMFHFAWANGTQGNDTFNVLADVTAATRTLMDEFDRGVWVDLGDGNDTVVGSAYGDNIKMGSGVSYIDGGTNLGFTPWGAKAQDSLDVYTTDASQKVAVTELTSGDGQAFVDGYEYKVTVSGTDTVAYIKGIEGVNVQLWDDKNGNARVDWDNNELTFQQFVPLAVNVGEIRVKDGTNPKETEWGEKLSDMFHFAWANGTQGNDTFDAATDIGSTTLTLMDEFDRGVWVDLGNGNDTIVGSAYGDNINMGSGVSYINGGTNLGVTPWGEQARDTLDVFTTNINQVVSVTALTADDGQPFVDNYAYKVTISGTDTVAYIKEIEGINVQLWDDKNGDGQRDWNEDEALNEMSYRQFIPLALNVGEIRLDPNDPTQTEWGEPLEQAFHFAWANGSQGNESFDAAVHVSATTRGLMDQYKRGLWVDLGDGNDTVVGSAYGDSINMGSGISYIDGGANEGTTPWGNKARDSLDVYTSSPTQTVTVTALTQADGAVFTDDEYQYKVTISGKSGTIAYIKNIEDINVQVWDDKNGNGRIDWDNNELTYQKGIPLALTVNEIRETTPGSGVTDWGENLSEMFHFAWANGGDKDDTFTVATDVSQATRTLMTQYGRGVWADLGGGSNTIVGSDFGDNFTLGLGTNFVDGGTNLGTTPWGSAARDAVDVFLSDASHTVNVQTVTATEGQEGYGYDYKVTVTGEGSNNGPVYIRNIETINVSLWNDLDQDGERDWETEVEYLKNIPLVIDVFEDPTNEFHVAYVSGGPANDVFSTDDLSDDIKQVMDTGLIGVNVELGDGNDRATGSDYADAFEMGSGVNYVDGGLDKGTASWGGSDTIRVFLNAPAQLTGVSVSELDSSSSGTDLAAFNEGFGFKLVNTSIDETTYFKNIEAVVIYEWDDANENGVRDWDLNEVSNVKAIPLVPSVSVNQAVSIDSPFLGFVFGTSYDETLIGNTFATEDFGATLPPDFGVYMYGGKGLNTLIGTDANDFLQTHQTGSNIIDGGGGEGYQVFDTNTGKVVRAVVDTYRLFVEFDEPKTAGQLNDRAGGYTADDLNFDHYRIVDVRNWTDPLTAINSSTTGLTNKIPDGVALNDADLTAIGLQAQALSLTDGNSTESIDWIVVKREPTGGEVTGVDFLKDIEAVSFAIWHDRNDNESPSGGQREFLVVENRRVEAVDYTLSAADLTARVLRSRSGAAEGSIFDDVIDLSGKGIGNAGFRVYDDWGNDSVIGTSFDDFFNVSRGNDTINGGDGNDIVGMGWTVGTGALGLSLIAPDESSDILTFTVVEQLTEESSRDVLTVSSSDSGLTWTVTPLLETDEQTGPIRSLANDAGPIGTDTLSNIEQIMIFANGDTSVAATLTLQLSDYLPPMA